MKNINKYIILILLISSLVISGCGSNEAPTQKNNDLDSTLDGIDDALKATNEAIARQKTDLSYDTFDVNSETYGLVDTKDYDPRDDLESSPLLLGLRFEGDVVMGVGSSNAELKEIINSIEIKEIDDSSIKVARDKIKDEYILSGKILDITSSTEYLDGEIFFATQLTDEEFKKVDPYNCGFIYYAENGNTYFEKGVVNLDSKKLYVPVTHFSVREWIFGKKTNQLDAMIKAEAKRYTTIANSHFDAKILELAQSNQFINGLDPQMKTKVLNNLFANKDRLAELAAAAGGDDSVNVGKSISLWFGKTVVDSIPEDKLADVFGASTLKGLVDNIDTVEKAKDQLLKGNYWKTVGVIGGDFFDNSNAGLVLKSGIEGWKIAIKAGEDSKFNKMFDDWKATGSKANFWSDSDYHKGYSSLYRQYKLHHGCAGSDSTAKNCIEKLFKEKLELDTKVAVEEKRLQVLKDLYTKSAVFAGSETSSGKARGLNDQFKKINGRPPTDVESFKFFLKKTRDIEVNLKQLGIKGPYSNKFRLSDEANELLNGYIANGNDGYKKVFKKLMDDREKQLKLKETCSSNSDCKSDEVCDIKAESCVKSECSENSDCDNREICQDNKCISGCDNQDDCFTGQFCKEGKCISGCESSMDCNLDEICKKNKCIVGCDYDIDCSDEETCKDNKCIELKPEVKKEVVESNDEATCDYDGDCGEGYVCAYHECEIDTYVPEEEPSYYEDVECETDSDCSSGYSCNAYNNECIVDEEVTSKYLDTPEKCSKIEFAEWDDYMDGCYCDNFHIMVDDANGNSLYCEDY